MDVKNFSFEDRNNPAFTLAEVLITLAIIGVVAALTIPSVVRNYQKTQTVTKLKKVFSTIANTTNLAVADHGPIANWETGTPGNGDDAKKFADTYIVPYLKVAKNCGTTTTGECKLEGNYLNREATVAYGSNWTRFYLNDGTLVLLTIRYYGYDPTQNIAARIEFDLNGQKKPNTFGIDIFSFDYMIKNFSSGNGTFVPLGSISNTRDYLKSGIWGCHKGGAGSYCTGLIMKDAWEIKDDYPW